MTIVFYSVSVSAVAVVLFNLREGYTAVSKVSEGNEWQALDGRTQSRRKSQ